RIDNNSFRTPERIPTCGELVVHVVLDGFQLILDNARQCPLTLMVEGHMPGMRSGILNLELVDDVSTKCLEVHRGERERRMELLPGELMRTPDSVELDAKAAESGDDRD